MNVLWILFLVLGNGRHCNTQCPDSDAIEEINELLESGKSCQGRCGEVVQVSDNPENITDRALGYDVYRTSGCSCDSLCDIYNDCCFDFLETCAREVENKATRSKSATTIWKSFPCAGADSFPCKTYQLVSKCISDDEPCEQSDHLNPDLYIPVHDGMSGIHYVHRMCALCNGAQNINPWNYQVECERDMRYERNRDLSARELMEKYQCEIKIEGPEQKQSVRSYPHELEIVQECSIDCDNFNLPDKCVNGSISYVSAVIQHRIPERSPVEITSHLEYSYYGHTEDVVDQEYQKVKNYRNIFCGLCNGINLTTVSSHLTKFYPKVEFLPEHIINHVNPIGKPSQSLTVLFEFDGGHGFTLQEALCDEPSGILIGSTCIFLPTQGTVTLEYFLMNTNSRSNLEYDLEFTRTTFSDRVQDKARSVFDAIDVYPLYLNLNMRNHFPIDKEEQTYETEEYLLRNNEDIPLLLKFEVSIWKNAKKQEFLEMIKEFELLGRLLILEMNSSFSTVYISTKFNNEYVTLPLPFESIPIFCERGLENNATYGNITGNLLAKTEILSNHTIVCYYNTQTDKSDPGNVVLGTITFWCIIFSILCLAVRICLQCEVPHFKSGPGKMQFFLTIALLFAFSAWLVGSYLEDHKIPCKVLAILRHYAFLAAFAWMTNIAIDTWRLFRPHAQLLNPDSTSTPLLQYHIIGWIGPFLLTGLVLILDYVEIPQSFKPYFGQPLCWMLGKALLYYFFIPTGLLLFTNLILFILTSRALRISFRQSGAVIQNDTNNFQVYVKLFILMGITWSLGFVVAFTDSDIIEYIFAIVNSLQGVFIFIAFVCTKRTFKHFAKKYRSVSTSSSSKQRTGSTPLSSSR